MASGGLKSLGPMMRMLTPSLPHLLPTRPPDFSVDSPERTMVGVGREL